MSSEFSDTDSDDGFNEDMEALKRACQLTGETPADNQLQLPSTTAAGGIASDGASWEGESDGEGDDDLRLVRSIQERFAEPMNMGKEPLRLKPLLTVMPDWSDSDDIEEDYETLRAIQRRFDAYSDGICCSLPPCIKAMGFSYIYNLESLFNQCSGVACVLRMIYL